MKTSKTPFIRAKSSLNLLLLLILPLSSLSAQNSVAGADSVRKAEERLDGLIEHYGDAAYDIAIINEALRKVARRQITQENRTNWEAAMERIAALSLDRRSELDRIRLSRAWGRMAVLVRKMDGPTVQYVDLLEVAYELNPDDEVLRKEVDYQRTRKAILQARTAEAIRIRAARKNGGEVERPYIGGPNQTPTENP